MINSMSNRSFAWLSGTLIMAIVVVAVILQHSQEVSNAFIFLKWAAIGIALISILYGLYQIYHRVMMRRLERLRAQAEIEQVETNKWVAEQTLLGSQQIEHDRIKLEQMKLQLEHERLMIAAQWQNQYVAVPEGHTVVFREEMPGMTAIRSPRVPVNQQIGEGKGANANMGNVIPANYPAPIDFAQVLTTFRPTPDAIYLLNTTDDPITVPMGKVCHVGIGGPTGGGKTNITRMITSQIQACDGIVYMANPNYNPVKLNSGHIEDWRPIVRRLKAPVARDIKDIKKLLDQFLTVFERRKLEADRSIRRGADIFLVVCELPAIIAQDRDTAEPIGRLLREARQYGIHVISEFQDALVSTIGGNSGVRENYRTGYYSGGDLKTAQILLDLEKGQRVDEEGIGQKGAVYLRCESTKAISGRVPFFSNKAMYDLLGYPPDPMPDTIIVSEDQIPETFWTLAQDGRYIPPALGASSGIVESTIQTRQDERDTPEEFPAVGEYQARSTGPLNALSERSDATVEDDYPRLTDMQVAQFKALYKIRSNIDFCLKEVKAGSAYRQHARALVEDMKNEAGRA